ncbi:MAG TPA: hypothetical protein VIA62_07830 [Thermoanaerobaculia bacterium]|jgi:hypothetical protein|nr:hypothetical protein [Thermoanaerobaculia bacterium]
MMPRFNLRAVWVVALMLLVSLSFTAGAQEPAATPAPSGHAMHGSSGAPGGHMAGLPKAAPADVATPEAIVTAYYEALSGPAAKKRDWNRFLSLFFPGARLLPAEGKGHSGTMPHTFSPSKYLFDTESNMLQEGYIAKEVAHRSEGFGKLLHVWSTYEARHAAADAKPFVRGITSFQLFNDGKRWWIFDAVWQPETSKLTLPAEDLKP